MSIEIKQLLIKSNIVQKNDDEGKSLDYSALTEGVLEQCRRLILEILSEKGER
jgi:hypothetical protein